MPNSTHQHKSIIFVRIKQVYKKVKFAFVKPKKKSNKLNTQKKASDNQTKNSKPKQNHLSIKPDCNNSQLQVKENKQHLPKNASGQEEKYSESKSAIEEMEKFIEGNKRYLPEEGFIQYCNLKEQSRQFKLTNKEIKEYHKTLKQLKIEIIAKCNDQSAKKQNEALVKCNRQIKENNNGLVTVIQEIKAGQESVRQCNDLLSKQSTMNKMLFLFSIFAAVFTTALICYAIFSHPSYVLDNVTAKQSIASLVNSAP